MVEIIHTQEKNNMSIYKYGLKYSDNGENQAVRVRGGFVHPIREPKRRKAGDPDVYAKALNHKKNLDIAGIPVYIKGKRV